MKAYKHPTKEIYYSEHFVNGKLITKGYSTRKEYKNPKIPKDSLKISNNEFSQIKNTYFVSKCFEWIYKNELYETCELENTIQQDGLYRHLVWHCGSVFPAYIRSDGRLCLQTNSGVKYTSKKNCLGIRKMI